MEICLVQGKAIDQVEQELLEKLTKKWREILLRFLDIIRFLTKQKLALHGHRETIEQNNEINSEKFLELVKLISKYESKFHMYCASVIHQ